MNIYIWYLPEYFNCDMINSLSTSLGCFSLFGLIQRMKNGLHWDNVKINSDNEFYCIFFFFFYFNFFFFFFNFNYYYYKNYILRISVLYYGISCYYHKIWKKNKIYIIVTWKIALVVGGREDFPRRLQNLKL